MCERVLGLSDRSVLSNQELSASLTDLSYPIRLLGTGSESPICAREAVKLMEMFSFSNF